MVRRTLRPSETVLSLLSDPSGRSRYSMIWFFSAMFLSMAWMVISVSISKPWDTTGKDFANR